jgi:hypothetical protein
MKTSAPSHNIVRARAVQGSFGLPRVLIETGCQRTAPAPTTTQNQGTVVLFTPSVSKTLNSIALWFQTATSSPTAIAYLMNASGGEPTGAKYGGALASTAATSISNAFVNFDFTAGGGGSGATALTAGTQYAVILDEQAVGGSFALGFSDSESISGWGMLYATTIANPVEDSVWNWKSSCIPFVHLNYSDGTQEVCKMTSGVTSSGNITLYGDPADAGTGRFAGIEITPKSDFMLERVDVSCRFTGTAATANAIELRLYNQLAAGGLLATSSNTVSAANDIGASGTNRIQTFTFSPSRLLQLGVRYWLLACQTGTGGSSNTTNHIQLDGGVGGTYVTSAFPPETAAESQHHGMVSVSSVTGLANVAFNGTTGHYMALWGIPLRR